MYAHLETDRLLIRPITTKDKQFILTLVNSPGWLTYIGDRRIRSINDAENYIRKIIENEKFFYSVFERKDTHQPLGIITFLYRDNQLFPDIGFALLPGYEGRGYTYEACRKYLDELIRLKVSTEIIGITLQENVKSINLLKRLGLKFQYNYTDESKTLSLYSMTIE